MVVAPRPPRSVEVGAPTSEGRARCVRTRSNLVGAPRALLVAVISGRAITDPDCVARGVAPLPLSRRPGRCERLPLSLQSIREPEIVSQSVEVVEALLQGAVVVGRRWMDPKEGIFKAMIAAAADGAAAASSS